MAFQLPPLQYNYRGEIRRVGFELEFAGLDLEGSAELLLQLFGGKLQRRSKFLYEIEGSCHGRYTIELDAAILTSKKYEVFLERLGIRLADSYFSGNIEELLARIASTVVPYEIISPPIPLPKLQDMEELKSGLRDRHAMGTKASLLYAFGLHLNPEVPSLATESLLAYLRSFLLLYDWIYEQSKIDLSRKIAPFIHEFPKKYLFLLLQPTYRPEMEQFMDDYLLHNPTRNRPLDMLPLFAFLDGDRIMARAEEKHLLKPRPAYHYRLPNCLIDDPSWSIAEEWNYWVEVEKLAMDPGKIEALSREFLQTLEDPFSFLQKSWAARVEEWLS
jgi:hypothetical protein